MPYSHYSDKAALRHVLRRGSSSSDKATALATRQHVLRQRSMLPCRKICRSAALLAAWPCVELRASFPLAVLACCYIVGIGHEPAVLRSELWRHKESVSYYLAAIVGIAQNMPRCCFFCCAVAKHAALSQELSPCRKRCCPVAKRVAMLPCRYSGSRPLVLFWLVYWYIQFDGDAAFPIY